MKFSEISVCTTTEASEVVAYFLQEACMDGVSIYDKNDLYANSSWDYKDDGIDKSYGEEVIVKGYCNLEDTDRVLDFLRQSFVVIQNAGSLNMTVNQVDGDAWVKTWKETFKPIETDKLVICPEWQNVETDKKVLLLDTGVAFGTGQHETTSMCIKLCEQLPLTDKSVLDVGCGSGILGLSALLLGAKNAELIDIDSQATDIARHNAEINGLTDCCSIKTGNLTEQTNERFDIVFANLTADILELLHKDILKVVKSNSKVVLSGILDVKLQQVMSIYSDCFNVEQVVSQGEWRALLLSVKRDI